MVIMQKKCTARGLMKTLFFGQKSQWITLIVFSVISLGLLAASAFLGARYGEEDYFMSVFILVMAYYMPCFLVLLFLAVTGNSRFLYSAPLAKRLMTVGLPLLGASICAGITLIAAVLTGISLSLGLTDGNRMSDVLMTCAVASLVILFCFSMYHSAGLGFFGLFFGLLMLVFACSSAIAGQSGWLYRLSHFGFGVPVGIAVVVCIAVYVLGIPLSFWLAEKSYRRRSSRGMVNTQVIN